jgi:hypothetical protein
LQHSIYSDGCLVSLRRCYQESSVEVLLFVFHPRIRRRVLEKCFFIVIMWMLRIRYLLTCESEIKGRNCSFPFQDDFSHHRFIFLFSSSRSFENETFENYRGFNEAEKTINSDVTSSSRTSERRRNFSYLLVNAEIITVN